MAQSVKNRQILEMLVHYRLYVKYTLRKNGLLTDSVNKHKFLLNFFFIFKPVEGLNNCSLNC